MQRFVEEAWIPVRRPLKHEDLSARRYVKATDFAIANRFAAKSVRRWVKTHRLFYDLFRVFQP